MTTIEIFHKRIKELEERMQKPFANDGIKAVVESSLKLNKYLLKQEMMKDTSVRFH